MDDLIKLVRTYRVTSGLAERQRLGDKIFEIIEPELHRWIFGAIQDEAAEDVFQEAAKDIATGLSKFKGNSKGEIWAWCRSIARNKMNDHFRKKGRNRLQPVEPEILWQLVEDDARSHPLSAADRLDLREAVKLLAAAKPGCDDYLWKYFVDDLDYDDIAAEENISDNAMRMRINRCLEEARALMT